VVLRGAGLGSLTAGLFAQHSVHFGFDVEEASSGSEFGLFSIRCWSPPIRQGNPTKNRTFYRISISWYPIVTDWLIAKRRHEIV